MDNEARTDQQTFIEDGSRDRAYFVITPQLVWAKCQDPFELALWTVVKMVAGEDGECTLSGPQLAALSMMSYGKCVACRQRLLDIGLLEGSIQQDPGYPKAVWHLKIPDQWEENVAWRKSNNRLRDRIELKREQREALKACPADTMEDLSPGDTCGDLSPGDSNRPPGDSNRPPGDRHVSPGDTKKIHEEEPKGDPKGELAPVWKEAQEWLAGEMRRSSYETWIAPARLALLEGENGIREAVIEAPNSWVTDWLRERLDVPIRRALAGALAVGEDAIRVEYRTGGG